MNATIVEKSPPDDHFTASPDCGVVLSPRGGIGGSRRCPTIGAGIVSLASVQIVGDVISTPDDHFTASPDGRVAGTFTGNKGAFTGHCPGVGGGIVSPARIGTERAIFAGSAPDNHLIASPDGTVITACGRRVGGARCGPAIGVGIISAPGIADVHSTKSTPDNHFTASPYRPVRVSY